MWPREADTALFRPAVHSRRPTRPWLGVYGFEFVLRGGWSGMGRRDFERRRRSTRNAAVSRPTGNPVAFVPAFETAAKNSPPVVQALMKARMRRLDAKQPGSGRDKGAGEHAVGALNAHFTIKSHFCEMCQTIRVVGIGFVGGHVERGLGMTGIDADRRQNFQRTAHDKTTSTGTRVPARRIEIAVSFVETSRPSRCQTSSFVGALRRKRRA